MQAGVVRDARRPGNKLGRYEIGLDFFLDECCVTDWLRSFGAARTRAYSGEDSGAANTLD